MKIKVNPRLRAIVSKHFVQRLPKITIPAQATFSEFKQYWEKCTLTLKRNSLIFFSKDLIDLVNKTNNRLLYCDLLNKKQQNSEVSGSQDYQLLNAFEMLWNIENTATKPAQKEEDKKTAQNSERSFAEEDNLDLVKILSHTNESGSQSDENGLNFGTSKVQGHALTIKDEFLNLLLDICCQVTQNSFLQSNDESFLFSIDTQEKLFIVEEELLFKAIDTSQIKSWEEFEYALAVIIENRFLQLYQSHLDKEYQKKWKKIDQELMGYQEFQQKTDQKFKSTNKKPKNKKKKKRSKKDHHLSQDLSYFKPCLSQILKIQRYIRRRKIQNSRKEKLQFSDKKKNLRTKIGKFSFPLEFRKEEFLLDFNTVLSDKSTTDNFVSDDEQQKMIKTQKAQVQKKDLLQQSSRQSQQDLDGKFYCYWPQQYQMKSEESIINDKMHEFDDVSSESSLDSENESEYLEQHMQKCYYESYIAYEQAARERNYVVDTYNYNPHNIWQNMYLHNQQMEQLMALNNQYMQWDYNGMNQNYYPGQYGTNQ